MPDDLLAWTERRAGMSDLSAASERLYRSYRLLGWTPAQASEELIGVLRDRAHLYSVAGAPVAWERPRA